MAIPLCLARHHPAGDAIGKPPIRSALVAARIKDAGCDKLGADTSVRMYYACSNYLNLHALPSKNSLTRFGTNALNLRGHDSRLRI